MKNQTKPATKPVATKKPATKPATKKPVATTRKSTLTAKDKVRIYRPAANIAHVTIALDKSADMSYTKTERDAFAASAREKLSNLTKTERARYFELHPKHASKKAA